jgi:23S rRNA (pseudouridine1915-N3)-methyltransferase
MKITILSVGKDKGDTRLLCADYISRLKRKVNMEVVELEPRTKPKDENALNRMENELILHHLSKKDAFIVCLDRGGKQCKSEEFSQFLSECMMMGKELVFVIGGSYGLSQDVLSRSNKKISFSKMTFPHMLFRVMLLEQIYRGYKILDGETYHK